MPIIRPQRDHLAKALDQLISGEITTDQFADGLDDWENCDDPAVVAIAEFGDGLFSDGLFAARLTGKHALAPELQQKAIRCIAFLRTDEEYAWPREACPPGPFFALWGPGWYLLLASVFLFAAYYSDGRFSFYLFGLIGTVCSLPAIHWVMTF